MDRLDIEDSDIQNRLLLWLRKKNPSKFYQFVLDKLTDFKLIPESENFDIFFRIIIRNIKPILIKFIR